MRLHDRFEWGEDKERQNQRDHKFSLEEAATVLFDPYADVFHLSWQDYREDYGEDRWITLASHPYNRARVLYIVWTSRADERGPLTRIISARPATPRERKRYEAFTYPI